MMLKQAPLTSIDEGAPTASDVAPAASGVPPAALSTCTTLALLPSQAPSQGASPPSESGCESDDEEIAWLSANATENNLTAAYLLAMQQQDVGTSRGVAAPSLCSDGLGLDSQVGGSLVSHAAPSGGPPGAASSSSGDPPMLASYPPQLAPKQWFNDLNVGRQQSAKSFLGGSEVVAGADRDIADVDDLADFSPVVPQGVPPQFAQGVPPQGVPPRRWQQEAGRGPVRFERRLRRSEHHNLLVQAQGPAAFQRRDFDPSFGPMLMGLACRHGACGGRQQFAIHCSNTLGKMCATCCRLTGDPCPIHTI